VEPFDLKCSLNIINDQSNEVEMSGACAYMRDVRNSLVLLRKTRQETTLEDLEVDGLMFKLNRTATGWEVVG
jgi:hypothetical protein